MSSNSILITGGTGFLGSALTHALLDDEYSVTILSRSEVKVKRQFGDSVSVVTSMKNFPDAGQFFAVVNLAGAGIFDRRWTKARKQILRDSRIKLTEQLLTWMSNSKQKPAVFISGSAIGYYGDQGDEFVNEMTEPKADFAHQLCADWETAALKAESIGMRVCLIRTGLVLGKGGGILQRLLLPFRLGFGGRMGDGNQWMSWVHIDDWVAIVRNMMTDAEMRGAYNAAAPVPVTNEDFSATLAGLLKRPMLLPMPAVVLKLLLGEMAVLILGSQRVLPQRLLAGDFQFRYSQLDAALRNILIST